MTAEDVEAKNIAIQWQKNKKYLNAEQYRHAQQIVLPNRLKVSKVTFILPSRVSPAEILIDSSFRSKPR